MVLQEINDGLATENFNSIFGYLAEDLPKGAKNSLKRNKNSYTKNLYHNNQLGNSRNTYNWPYDYCSLIELGKISTKTTFRPDLELEQMPEPPKGPPPFEGPFVAGQAPTLQNLLSLAGGIGGARGNLNIPSGQINQPEIPDIISQFSPPAPIRLNIALPPSPKIVPAPVQPLKNIVAPTSLPYASPLAKFNYVKNVAQDNTPQLDQLKKRVAQNKIMQKQVNSPFRNRQNQFAQANPGNNRQGRKKGNTPRRGLFNSPRGFGQRRY